MFEVFETNRLILKPIEQSEALFLQSLMNTPKALKYIGDRNIRSENDARRYIQNRLIPVFAKFGFGTYVLYQKNTNIPMGTCGFYDREGLDGIDIGYAILPKYERRGFTLEAVRFLSQSAFSQFRLEKLLAVTDPQNFPSIALLEKVGFKFCGKVILPDHGGAPSNYFELIPKKTIKPQ